MKLQRLRVRLAALIAVVVAVVAIGPLLLWRSERSDAIYAEFDRQLVEQMEYLQRWLQQPDPDQPVLDEPWFPAWYVNASDEWIDVLTDTDLEPPLITWVREAGDWQGFRTVSLDGGSELRGYVNPIRPSEALVVLNGTDWRAAELAALRRWVLVAALGLVLVSALLGWMIAGLALGPTRRVLADREGFLADAAHEMRTPLAVITASSSQALARPRSGEEYVRSLSEIRSAAERASTGVNELLDLVRFDSGQAIPRLAPLRLDLLAEEVAASTIVDDGERHVTVVAEPSAPVVVSADLALVRQALDNVVRNAVRRASRVELTSGVDDRFGVVEITDDGPGFDPAILPTVFERYQRGDRRGETGIGLAIVKAIVEANGGSVVASNRPAAIDGAATGAVIRIALPLNR